VAAAPAAETGKTPAETRNATAQATTPPVAETAPAASVVPEKPVPPAAAPPLEKPEDSPLAPPAVQAAAESEKELPPSPPTVPDLKSPSPAATTANKLLQNVLKAGAFSYPAKPSSEATEKSAGTVQAAPETAASQDSTPATPDEPDPSAVINWLLKKKSK
jgi:hypothetical protein